MAGHDEGRAKLETSAHIRGGLAQLVSTGKEGVWNLGLGRSIPILALALAHTLGSVACWRLSNATAALGGGGGGSGDGGGGSGGEGVGGSGGGEAQGAPRDVPSA